MYIDKSKTLTFRLGLGLKGVVVAQQLCSKCLLSPPGDADWSLGPGWTSEWMIDREKERERKNKIGGEGEPVKTGDDSSWRPLMPGQTKPLTWTHTLTVLRGPRRRGKTSSWGQRVRGQTDGALFLLDQRTNYKDDWTSDRPTDGETPRRVGGINGSPPAEEKVTHI